MHVEAHGLKGGGSTTLPHVKVGEQRVFNLANEGLLIYFCLAQEPLVVLQRLLCDLFHSLQQRIIVSVYYMPEKYLPISYGNLLDLFYI